MDHLAFTAIFVCWFAAVVCLWWLSSRSPLAAGLLVPTLALASPVSAARHGTEGGGDRGDPGPAPTLTKLTPL